MIGGRLVSVASGGPLGRVGRFCLLPLGFKAHGAQFGGLLTVDTDLFRVLASTFVEPANIDRVVDMVVAVDIGLLHRCCYHKGVGIVPVLLGNSDRAVCASGGLAHSDKLFNNS